MKMTIKEDNKRGKYKGFIYSRGANELGIDFHALDDEEKVIGNTRQICLYINPAALKSLQKEIDKMVEANNIKDPINMLDEN